MIKFRMRSIAPPQVSNPNLKAFENYKITVKFVPVKGQICRSNNSDEIKLKSIIIKEIKQLNYDLRVEP